jgi:hypothetical protein
MLYRFNTNLQWSSFIICVRCSLKLPMVITTVLTECFGGRGGGSRDSVYGMLLVQNMLEIFTGFQSFFSEWPFRSHDVSEKVLQSAISTQVSLVLLCLHRRVQNSKLLPRFIRYVLKFFKMNPVYFKAH